MQMTSGQQRFESDLERYLDEARRQPLLAPDQERLQAERWRDMKDPEAARQLAASHLRLVIKIARRYRGYGLPLGDLIGAGNVGLMQALDPVRAGARLQSSRPTRCGGSRPAYRNTSSTTGRS